MDYNLTKEEQEILNNWKDQMEAGETMQIVDLVQNCKNPYQFAKTHSVYKKDWEKTKNRLEKNLSEELLPPNTSKELHQAIIETSDEIMEEKLKLVREEFEKKFGESIYNYLGKDGKTKGFFSSIFK